MDKGYRIMKCPKCGKMITEIDNFEDRCPYCGEEIPAQETPVEVSTDIKKNKFNMKNFLLVLCGLLLLVIGYMGYTMKQSDNLVNTIRDELSTEKTNYDNLQSKLDDIQNEYNADKSNLENITAQYEESQKTIETLNATVSDLKNQANALSNENQSLKNKISSLESSQQQTASTPIPASQSSESSVVSSDGGGDGGGSGGSVWLSETGTKYHNKPNCGNMNPDNATQVTESYAISHGYTACKKCF